MNVAEKCGETYSLLEDGQTGVLRMNGGAASLKGACSLRLSTEYTKGLNIGFALKVKYQCPMLQYFETVIVPHLFLGIGFMDIYNSGYQQLNCDVYLHDADTILKLRNNYHFTFRVSTLQNVHHELWCLDLTP